jgi:hypothetical protein
MYPISVTPLRFVLAATKPIAVSESSLVMAQHFQLELSLSVSAKLLRTSEISVKGLLDQYCIESGCDIVGNRASASDSRRGRRESRCCLDVVFVSAMFA